MNVPEYFLYITLKKTLIPDETCLLSFFALITWAKNQVIVFELIIASFKHSS